MSAPDTNTEKEEKRHRHALLGIRASMVYAAILLVGLVIWMTVSSDEDTGEPGGDDTVQTVPEGQETEEALQGFEEETYEPGGNSTGSVSADGEEGSQGGGGDEASQ